MAAEEKGLIIVHTGDGKGKTTAALGLAMRAWGDGLSILIIQFIKGDWKYGELETISKLQELDSRIELRRMGKGFQRNDDDKAQHSAAAYEALEAARLAFSEGCYDMLILDEINYAVKFGLIEESDVLALLDEKPAAMHVVLTGRAVRASIADRADLVTEMRLIKHPYQQGIKAQKGIEF